MARIDEKYATAYIGVPRTCRYAIAGSRPPRYFSIREFSGGTAADTSGFPVKPIRDLRKLGRELFIVHNCTVSFQFRFPKAAVSHRN